MNVWRIGWVVPLTIGLALILGGAGLSHAQMMLIDDFDDGNDVGWTHVDELQNGGPGIFDARSGEYHIQSTGAVNPGGLWVSWNESENPLYSSGFLRMKVRSDASGGVVGGMMRANEGEPAYYMFVGDGYTHDFFIVRRDADGWVEYHMPNVEYNAGEEWIIECGIQAGVVEHLLSMKVWRPGDPVPDSPQLTRPERFVLPMGEIGVVSYIDVRNPAVRIDAMFDDIDFTPSPSYDFNGDNVADIDDLNLLMLEGPVADGVTVTPSVNGQFDLNGDGVIDNADVDAWLQNAATINGFGSAYKHGDANLDGFVDVSDVNLWNEHKFTSTLLWDNGNFNGDGFVDVSDFNIWNENKFTSSDTVASVPEPSVLILLIPVMIVAGNVVSRRRR